MPRVDLKIAAWWTTQVETLRAAGTRDRGASLVEYALLIAFIAVLCVGAVTVLGRETAEPLPSAAQGFKN